MASVRMHPDRRQQAGIAYVALLLLLTLLFTLGMVFLMQNANDSAMIVARSEGLQAHYLAESAANHALWRLLHEDDFPAKEDRYYLHDLAGGRYGYKVRRHTDTTFATIATVGGIGDTAVFQSYVVYVKPETIDVNLLATYVGLIPHPVWAFSSTPGMGARPFDGPDWGAEESAVALSTPGQWSALAGCPTRDEYVLAGMSGSTLSVLVRQGGAWGSQLTFSTEADSTYPCFAVAYESQSGDALVVGRGSNTSAPYYTTWNGKGWNPTSPAKGTDYTGGTLRVVQMASNPLTDEILVMLNHSTNGPGLYQWDGNALTLRQQPGVQLATSSTPCFTGVYEQVSGQALFLANLQGESFLRAATWNGTSLGLLASAPNFGAPSHFIRAAPDPTSDRVLVAALDTDFDLHLALWDGSSWISTIQLEASAAYNDRFCFDLTWTSTGSTVLVAWGAATRDTLEYYLWDTATSLSAGTLAHGPTTGSTIAYVDLEPVPNEDGVAVLAATSNAVLHASYWDGDTFTIDPPRSLETSLAYTRGAPARLATADHGDVEKSAHGNKIDSESKAERANMAGRR